MHIMHWHGNGDNINNNNLNLLGNLEHKNQSDCWTSNGHRKPPITPWNIQGFGWWPSYPPGQLFSAVHVERYNIQLWCHRTLPHSEDNFDAKASVSCLFEALFIFEIYGFEVLALVCDGASCNLSLLKQLCGVTGQYRSVIKCADTTLDDGEEEGDDGGGIGDVPCWFINPYSGGKIYRAVATGPVGQVFTGPLFSQ